MDIQPVRAVNVYRHLFTVLKDGQGTREIAVSAGNAGIARVKALRQIDDDEHLECDLRQSLTNDRRWSWITQN